MISVHPCRTRSAVFAALALAIPAFAAAQDPEEVLPLRELVVSATRTATEVRDVPVNVTVIMRDELSLSTAQNLEDVLMEIPGVAFQRNVRSGSAHPSWQAVSLRGLGGTAASRTLVMVDGVPLNDGFFGWVRWDQVPLETIERIEIVRGGGSTAWGGQSLAGVIHVITRDPDAGGLSIGAEAGTQSTLQGDAMATFGGGALSGFLAGEVFDTDGYILTTPDQRGAVDVPSSADHVALRAKATLEASETVRILASGSYYDEDKLNSTPLRPNHTEAGFGSLGLRAGRETGSMFAVNLFGQGQTYRNAITDVADDRDSEEPSLTQTDVPSDAFGGNVQWSHGSLGSHALTAGVDVLRIHGEATEEYLYVNGSFQNRRHSGGDQLLTGVFVQDRIALGEPLEIVAGARLDVWNNSNGFRTISQISSGDIAEDVTFEDRSEVRFSGNVGARLRASDRVTLRASIYNGLRIPTLNELYKPFRASGGIATAANENLDPEGLFGLEGGVDYAMGRQWLIRGTAFLNEVSDAIFDATIMEVDQGQVVDPCGFIPAGGACRQRMNVGTVRSIGLETEVEFRPAAAWMVGASFDYNWNEITEAEGRDEIVGNRPPRTPKAQAALRVGHVDASILEAVLIGKYHGNRYENDLNTDEVDSAFLVDLRLARDLGRDFQLFASVQNIFDVEWEVGNESSLIRLGTPRVFTGGVRVRLAGASR
ncbi:MAG: TonB-dependent receptor [Gemmatimonadota bacterium]|nr:TonB-dependent receptor [Gemmatimonadota bacterium]